MNEFSRLSFLSYECMACYCSPRPRIARDYELDLYYGGKAVQTLDGKDYPAGRGTLVFRRPGQLSYSDGDYHCRMITFDLSGEATARYGRQHRLRTTPVQPAGETPLLDRVPPVFLPGHFEELNERFKRIEIFSLQMDGGRTEMQTQLDDALLELLLLICADAVHSRAEAPQPLNGAVFEICRYVSAHCGEELRVEELARRAGVSADYLTRLFRQEIGITPSEYIGTARVKKARFLLESTDQSIDGIAELCGYGSAAYFIKRFREKAGVTPKKYRRAAWTRCLAAENSGCGEAPDVVKCPG